MRLPFAPIQKESAINIQVHNYKNISFFTFEINAANNVLQRKKQLREQELKRKLEEEEEEEKKKRAEEADRKAKEADEASKSEASDKPSEPSSKQPSKVSSSISTDQAMKNAKIRQQRTFHKNAGLGERKKNLGVS